MKLKKVISTSKTINQDVQNLANQLGEILGLVALRIASCNLDENEKKNKNPIIRNHKHTRQNSEVVRTKHGA